MQTNKQLADGLDVPASRVSEWIARGMPRTSIQAAAAWRLVHARPRKGKAALVAQSRQDAPADDAPADDTLAEDNRWEARLNRTRKVEKEIFDTLRKALAEGDVNMLGKLQAAHVAAVKEIAAAESIALEARKASRELLHVNDVREIMREVLGPLRHQLDMLPVQERSRCNPERPDVAELALQEWLHRTLVMASTAESKF
jgi:hypothetical protein